MADVMGRPSNVIVGELASGAAIAASL